MQKKRKHPPNHLNYFFQGITVNNYPFGRIIGKLNDLSELGSVGVRGSQEGFGLNAAGCRFGFGRL